MRQSEQPLVLTHSSFPVTCYRVCSNASAMSHEKSKARVPLLASPKDLTSADFSRASCNPAGHLQKRPVNSSIYTRFLLFVTSARELYISKLYCDHRFLHSDPPVAAAAVCPFMIYGELVQRWRLSTGARLLKWPRETGTVANSGSCC